MRRVLGRVDYADLSPSRYFIHDDDLGWSFSPLFVDVSKAWHLCDQGGLQALETAMPKQSTLVQIVRKTLAHGRAFNTDGSIDGDPVYGLATDDRLLWPMHTDERDEENWSLMHVDDVIHVVREVWSSTGKIYKSVCDDYSYWYPPHHQSLPFEQYFGRQLNLCQNCLKKLLGASELHAESMIDTGSLAFDKPLVNHAILSEVLVGRRVQKLEAIDASTMKITFEDGATFVFEALGDEITGIGMVFQSDIKKGYGLA